MTLLTKGMGAVLKSIKTLKKLGKDVKQTVSVLEHFTPGGLTRKILKKGLPKLAKKGWK